MSQNRAKQKATLMKEAEAVIDELLDWQEQSERPNFSQIEAQVLKLREKLSRQMVSVTLLGEGRDNSLPEAVCPKLIVQLSDFVGEVRATWPVP